MGLFRRKNYSNIENVAQFIEREIRLSGSLHGYRWMHLKCLHHGFVVQKERVHELLNTLDPAGVEMRKKGNYNVDIILQRDPTSYGTLIHMTNLLHMELELMPVLMGIRVIFCG